MSSDSEEKIGNAIGRFATWLSETGKTTSTIAKYIHYLDVIARGYDCAIDDLTHSEEAFDKTIRGFDEHVPGTSGSLKTYKTALRAYRDFIRDGSELTPVREVQLFDPSDKGKKWYREFIIENKDCFSALIAFLNREHIDESTHKWIFRGQGYASWDWKVHLDALHTREPIFGAWVRN